MASSKISVNRITPDKYDVTVKSSSPTSHIVTITDRDLQRLAGNALSKEKLIEFSFRFLLEREPNTSIMRSFDLSIISNYFPEYEENVKSFSDNI
jgi:Ulp1 family protease|tara:strand:- start:1357 stop:1641 length:285 start_codon:yes stop_codon:yes gene_type:complete